MVNEIIKSRLYSNLNYYGVPITSQANLIKKDALDVLNLNNKVCVVRSLMKC